MAFDRAGALAAGYSNEKIDRYIQENNISEVDQPEPNILEKASNFLFPDITSTVSNVGTDLATQMVTGKGKTQPAKDIMGSGFGPLLQYALGVVAPDMQSESFKTVEPAAREVSTMYLLNELLPWLSKSKVRGGVSGKETAAAAKATEEGVSVPFQDIQSKTMQNVQKKLGWTPEVKKTFTTLMKEKRPSALGEASLNPTEILDWRRQIATRGGKNYFQRLFTGSSVPEKVEGVVRSDLSSILHETVPATRLPDILYTLYSKSPLGSPLEAPLRAAGGGATLAGAYSLLRNLLTPKTSNYYTSPMP